MENLLEALSACAKHISGRYPIVEPDLLAERWNQKGRKCFEVIITPE